MTSLPGTKKELGNPAVTSQNSAIYFISRMPILTTFCPFLHPDRTVQRCDYREKNAIAPFITILLTLSKLKLVNYLLVDQRYIFLWLKKRLFKEIVKTDFGVHARPIFVFKGGNRSMILMQSAIGNSTLFKFQISVVNFPPF